MIKKKNETPMANQFAIGVSGLLLTSKAFYF